MAARLLRRAGLKVASVVLGALLWLIVSGEQTVERALRIPLEFTNLPSQLELVGEPPTVVDVRVRGSSGALGRIAGGELVAVLDVRTARAGQRIFHLKGSDVRSPFGVDVVQVAPASLTLVFEKSSVKTVPIVPQVEGEPAQGFVVGAMGVDPARVEIVGPASALEGLTRAVTEAVSVEGARRTVTETVTVGVADPNVRLRGPQTARVSVSIVPAR